MIRSTAFLLARIGRKAESDDSEKPKAVILEAYNLPHLSVLALELPLKEKVCSLIQQVLITMYLLPCLELRKSNECDKFLLF